MHGITCAGGFVISIQRRFAELHSGFYPMLDVCLVTMTGRSLAAKYVTLIAGMGRDGEG